MALGVMKAQIVNSLGHHYFKHRISREAKNVLRTVVLGPFHGFAAGTSSTFSSHRSRGTM
jgi:hypothetical protein